MPHRIPYLIAYDITNTRTQARVRRTLQGYATGGQQSFYHCWLTAAEYRRPLYIFRINEQTETRLLGKAKTALAADAPLLII